MGASLLSPGRASIVFLPFQLVSYHRQVFSRLLLWGGSSAVQADGDPARLDTFISMPSSVKGWVVWRNGISLGRVE